MQGHKGMDHMMDIREVFNGCGERSEVKKKANKPRKNEGTNQSKLGGIGMMGKWMEVGAQLGIGVKLTINFPSNVCYESWDAWLHFGDGKPTGSAMLMLSPTYLI